MMKYLDEYRDPESVRRLAAAVRRIRRSTSTVSSQVCRRSGSAGGRWAAQGTAPRPRSRPANRL
ncbi:MAG: hypothetical protein JNL62_19770, partial [Bryobacterales bacterium]|nr:hypothetical protein [Bryobacterales bacterium]